MHPEISVADILAPLQAALAQTALDLAQAKAQLRAANARIEELLEADHAVDGPRSTQGDGVYRIPAEV